MAGALVATGAPQAVRDAVVAPASTGTHHVLEISVTAFGCDTYGDGVCLGYQGQVPGPQLVLHEGDTVEITLHNRINETLPALAVPQEVKDELLGAAVSLHVHGVQVPADEDGISSIPGTELVDSFVRPGESFTHHWTAAHKGAWHYHDHVMGVEGHEGQERGLYGTLLVLDEGERTDHVFDLHVLDNGANNGRGLDATAQTGDRFDLLAVGLGNWLWDIELEHPDGTLETLEVGPGVSKVFTVKDAQAGTYTWTATNQITFEEATGQVVVS